MPSFCAVANCGDKYGHLETISFHRFPFRRKKRLKKWLEFTQRETDWQPSKWSAICSRHFREQDFNCKNERKTLKKTAVPRVLYEEQQSSKEKPIPEEDETPSKPANQVVEDKPQEEEERLVTHCHNVTNVPKVNCRLCGEASDAVVTFASSFEIYGLIQKCLPTLNIQQDDNLPKDVCRECLKRLESFSSFIDQALETHRELMQKYRSEKPNNKASERQLKIKQEPVVRVKQEAEAFQSFFSDDLDAGLDETCEHEPDMTPLEHKHEMGDLPSNVQDIINNCDIMEIINLDDPFINIPDDDVSTAFDGVDDLLRPKQILPSADEMLQTHLLLEEHSYSQVAEDFKEEWQIKNTYKTEKSDGYEQHHQERLENAALVADYENYVPEEQVSQATNTTECQDTVMNNNLAMHPDENRSNKPIVTSVSAIAESRLQFPAQNSVNEGNLVVTSVKDVHCSNQRDKPNIVVLNESIVKSSSAFQLHTCPVCAARFFSIESLNHHQTIAHAPPPMVSLPCVTLKHVNNERRHVECCKMEEGLESNFQEPNQCLEKDVVNNIHNANESFNNGLYNNSVGKAGKNRINILEMRQTFVNHLQPPAPLPNLATEQRDAELESTVSFMEQGVQAIYNSIAGFEAPTINAELNEATAEVAPQMPRHAIQLQPCSGKYMRYREDVTPGKNQDNKNKSSPIRKTAKYSLGNDLADVHAHYRELQRRYRMLQRKCRSLQGRRQHSINAQPRRRKYKFNCRICMKPCATFLQYLHHKQESAHFMPKARSHFGASCLGCEKYFRSKLALNNHMRYICEMLSLRWTKKQMQTFKCRHCQGITFNHWRLCRRHEVVCKRRKMGKRRNVSTYKKSKESKTKSSAGTVKRGAAARISSTRSTPSGNRYDCPHCEKKFPNGTALNQHSITHTDGRSFKCGLCARTFKRRNGLMQHIKGFHLRIKPYECPTCKYCYSLKGDMLRCRHSLMRDNSGPKPTTV